jgi:IS5 family transposase
MRRHEQLSLDQPWIAHPHAKELEAISRLLDENPAMAEAVAADLVRDLKHPESGAPGMSGDQVLRVMLLKQMKGFSYEALHFHLMDSATYRTFCRIGVMEEVPARSTVAENVKKVRPETLEQVNRLLLGVAKKKGVERGRKVRIDATVVETDIHAPTDSALLYDGVRVLARLLGEAKGRCGFSAWSDHTRRAKRRMLAVQNARTQAKRREAYRDLLKVARKTVGYGEAAREALGRAAGVAAAKLRGEVEEVVLWLWAVIDQTERRVLGGETVPAGEKVVSLFETHTDIDAHGDHRQGQPGDSLRAQSHAGRRSLGADPGRGDRAGQSGRQHARRADAGAAERDLRPTSAAGERRRGLCLEAEPRGGEVAGRGGRLLCEEAGAEGAGDGAEQLGVPAAAELPRRHRGDDLVPEAGLRAGALHVEGRTLLRRLRVGVGRERQLSHAGAASGELSLGRVPAAEHGPGENRLGGGRSVRRAGTNRLSKSRNGREGWEGVAPGHLGTPAIPASAPRKCRYPSLSDGH